MAKCAVRRGKGWTVWYDEALLRPLSPEHFAPAFWRSRNAITGTAGGRNLAYFLAPGQLAEKESCRLVLRHYYRGGLVGRFNNDAFIGVQAKNSRAMREFALLQWMYEAGLPVPRPAAALFRRSGLLYRSDILIEQIPCDGDLFSLLNRKELGLQAWKQLGELIRTFHAKGIYHSDLNCHNILISRDGDSARFWLIDFDKCDKRQPGAWQEHNLQRLRRSLNKEAQAHPAFAFDDESHWTVLMDGYHEK